MNTTENVGDAPSTPPPRKPRRRIFVWAKRIALIALVVVLLVRLTLPLWLPSVVDAELAKVGLRCTYEDYDLVLLEGDVELRHVEVWLADAEATAPPLTHVEYARLDIDVSDLFGLRLRVHRVELDGLAIRALRREDGSWALPQPTAAPADEVAVEAPPEPTPAPTAWDLSVPLDLRLDAVLVQHLRLQVDDRLLGIEQTLDAEMRVTDLGHPNRPMHVAVKAIAPDFVDVVDIAIEVHQDARKIVADGRVDVRGVHPWRGAKWFEAAGLKPVAHTLDMRLGLHARVDSAADRRSLTASLRLADLAIAVVGTDEVSIASIEASATIEPARVEVDLVRVSDVELLSGRDSLGAIHVLGFELMAATTPPSMVEAPVADVAPAPAPHDASAQSVEGADDELVFGVTRLEIDGIKAVYSDLAVTPAASLEARIDRLELDQLGRGRASRLLVRGACLPALPAWTFEANITPHAATAARDDLDFVVNFAARDVDLSTLDPWLVPLGISGELRGGLLEFTADGGLVHGAAPGELRVTAALRELALTATAQTPDAAGVRPLALREASVVLALTAGSTRIEDALLAGLVLPVRRDAQGGFELLGLRTHGAATRSASRSDAAAAAPPAGAAAAPVVTPSADASDAAAGAFAIDRLRLTESRLSFVDAATDDGTARELEFELAAELRDLALGAARERTARGSFSIESKQIGAFELETRIASRPGPLDLDATVDLRGTALQLAPLEALLADLGLAPTMSAGSLRAHVEAAVRKVDEPAGWHASLRVADVALLENDQELIGVDELRVDDISSRASGTRVGNVALRGVRAVVARDAAGILHAAGIAVAKSEPPAAAATIVGTDPDPVEADDRPAGVASTPPSETSAPQFELGGLTVEGVKLRWLDAAARTPVDTELAFAMSLGELAPGRPTSLALELGIAELLESLRITGSLTLDPTAPRLDLTLEGRGLRGAPAGQVHWLDAYLQSGQSLALRDGRLRGRLSAGLDPHPEGGQAIDFGLREFDLRDGPDGAPLIAVGEVSLRAPRVDPVAGGLVRIDELAARGIEALLRRDGDAWLVCGMRIAAAGDASVAFDPLATPIATDAPPEPSAAAAPVASGAVQSRFAVPPRVEIGTLALQVTELTIEDGDAEPLRFGLTFDNREPITVIAPDPEQLAPWRFVLVADAGAALESLRVDLDVRPWQFEPFVGVELALRGLHGAAIHAALPSLTQGVDLRGIEGGNATASLEVRLDLRRRDPTEFDLSRGFGLETQITNVGFRATPDGPLLAGVESVFLAAPRLGGESGAVHVRELAIEGITGRARRDAAGLHVLGMVVLPSPATDAPAQDSVRDVVPTAEAAGSGDAGAEAQPNAPSVAAPVANAAAPSIRIDRVDVNGLDFVFEDETFDPPLRLPLDELALTLASYRSGGSEPPPPMRFHVLLGTGDVELPKRVKASSLLAGFLASAGRAVTGGGDDAGTEERTVLGEFVVSGQVTPSDPPVGEIDLSLTRLELLALRGPAAAGGVEVGDGIFDARVHVEMSASGKTEIETSLSLADLMLDEPPGGPISTYLKLPAPLQSVLFVLKDDADEIGIPMTLSIDEAGGVSATQIAGSAVSAFGKIVANAIASSPFRVAGTFTGLLGIGGPTEIPPEARVMFEYEAGAVTPPSDARHRLATLLDVLDDAEMTGVIQPILGNADLQRASMLAIPSEADRLQLVERLRARKQSLWRDRDTAASALDVLLRLGAEPAAVELQRTEVRALDAAIGTTETALDKVLELLRPGAERGRDRRARRLAFEFATARAEALRTLLVEHLGIEASDRIEIRRPRLPLSDDMESGVVTLEPRLRKQ